MMVLSDYDKRIAEYRKNTTVTNRIRAAQDVKERYPGCVPIIIGTTNKRLAPAEKYRFCEDMSDSFSKFYFKVLKFIPDVSPSDSLYWFTETNVLIHNSCTIGEIYHKYANRDVMLYLLYAKENTFG